MAGFDVLVQTVIDKDTAEICLKVVQAYVNQHKGIINIECKTLPDGSNVLTFWEADPPTIEEIKEKFGV